MEHRPTYAELSAETVRAREGLFLVSPASVVGAWHVLARRGRAGGGVPVYDKDDELKAKLGPAAAFVRGELMLAPWIVNNLLTFLSVSALVTLVGALHSTSAKERREARRRLNLAPEKSKDKKKKDKEFLETLELIFALTALSGPRAFGVLPLAFIPFASSGLRKDLQALKAESKIGESKAKTLVAVPAPSEEYSAA